MRNNFQSFIVRKAQQKEYEEAGKLFKKRISIQRLMKFLIFMEQQNVITCLIT